MASKSEEFFEDAPNPPDAPPRISQVEELRRQVVKLLAHCPDTECPECSRIICPHKDPQHFHHAGCPSCGNDREAA